MTPCLAPMVLALLFAAPVAAQDRRATGMPPEDADEVTVVGDRRSIVRGIDPLATFDANAIAATGATTISELLRAIRGVTQSADGSEPIFLLNGQRTSGYQDIGALPPEAIEKVEVMPEPVALKFGYPPTRRVLNFITRRRFRQSELRGGAGTTTRGGGATTTGNYALTRLRNDSRLTLGLEYRRSTPILQSDRGILPDPDQLFGVPGTITGLGGGEIDPALSAQSGRVVTVAGVPGAAGDRTLAGFATQADRPAVFDQGPYRTLAPRRDSVKAEAVIADRIGKTMSGSISLMAERNRERNLAGPAPGVLLVPAGNAFSPFAGPVLLYRFLTEVDPLRQRQITTTLHGGGTLRGTIDGWRWDVTAALDQQQVDGRSARAIDLTAANAAIANGADPFGPIDPALLGTRVTDVAQLRTRSGMMKAVATKAPFRVPAGEVSITASTEVERVKARSFTRGTNPFSLSLGRDRIEGSLAVDVPLTSRREDMLAFAGDLSVNGSASLRTVSGFGSLRDSSFGAVWGPFAGVQLLASVRRTVVAPTVTNLSTPEVRLANVPVFDSTTGRTELVTVLTGGNPDLRAERRHVRSLGVTVKPFKAREWRIGATYEVATIRDQTGTVYALTPQTEAILPDLVTRDAAGRLASVAYRPVNYDRERQRTLNLTVNAFGMIGRAPVPAAPGAPPPPDSRPSFYGGMGPTIRFADRLRLRPGAPEFDLLRGDTVIGNGAARVQAYLYGGISHQDMTFRFDAWYGGANRVRSALPEADLHFLSIFKLNAGGLIGIDRFVPQAAWAKKLQLKLDIDNVTDARPRVRDGTGVVPNRFQPGYLDPVGRTVTLSVRKLF